MAVTTDAFYLQPYNLASFAPLASPYTGNVGYYPYYHAMPPSYGYGYSLATETDHNRLRSGVNSETLQVREQVLLLTSKFHDMPGLVSGITRTLKYRLGSL